MIIAKQTAAALALAVTLVTPALAADLPTDNTSMFVDPEMPQQNA